MRSCSVGGGADEEDEEDDAAVFIVNCGSAAAGSAAGANYTAIERKARMTALTPIVFHSAFVDHDPLALDILRSASGAVASLIARNLAPLSSSRHSSSGSSNGGESFDMPVAASSVLCLGGSLVGVPAYRELVLEHLRRMGHVFPHVEFVKDAAEAGVIRLASMYAREMELANRVGATKMVNGNGVSGETGSTHA